MWKSIFLICFCLIASCGDPEGGLEPGDTRAAGDTTRSADADGGADVESSPERATLERAIEGLGGVEALEGLEGFRVIATGEHYLFGEGYEATLEDELRASFSSTLTVDLAEDRWHIASDRAVDNFGFPMMIGSVESIVGQRTAITGCDSVFFLCTTTIRPNRQAALKKHHALFNPHILLRRAWQEELSISLRDDAMIDGVTHQVLAIEGSPEETLVYIHADSGVIAQVTTREIEPVMGDALIEVRFSGWRASSGGVVMFPERVEARSNGLLLNTEEAREVEENPELDPALFEAATANDPIEDAALSAWGETHAHWLHRSASGGVPFDGEQTAVALEEMSPGSGVFFIAGSHGSVVVEQEDGLVLIEAPLHERRMDAVIDAIQAQLPGKPITHVIATHHHYDHSGGARAAVATGATLVASERGEAFFQAMIDASFSVSPDALAKAPVETTIEAVSPAGGAFVIGEGPSRVEVWHIETPHAADMVIAYIPSIKAFFQSDLYVPGEFFLTLPILEPFRTNGPLMVDEIDRLGLDVEWIIGGHGAFIEWDRAREHIANQ